MESPRKLADNVVKDELSLAVDALRGMLTPALVKSRSVS
jgi:hypothetical protein